MPNAFDRRTLLRHGVTAGMLMPLAGLAATETPAATASAETTPAVTPRRPHFPDKWFPVGEFGAVGDGRTDDTAAFRRAVQACHRAGGGHVLATGTHASGPIHLLSNVDLHLAAGSRILFSTNPSDYLPAVGSRWQGIEFMNYSPLVYAYDQTNIAVTGSGVLDGQADSTHWWDWKAQGDNEFPLLEAQANAGVPVASRMFGQGFHFRPPFAQPYRCDRVLIQGVTFTNSPFWHLNPVLCTNVTVDGVTVNSTGPNTDGCDPESCDGVLITGCSFDTGDDCIAIKSGRNADGRRLNVPCQNIVIAHSTFANGHGGVTIGGEMTGGVRNVHGHDLTMNSAGLASCHRIKTNSVRGGYVEAVLLERVDVGAVGGPMLLIDFDYGEGDTGSYLPTVTDINLVDWTVGSCVRGWQMAGYQRGPIGTVRLTDVAIGTMSGADVAINVRDLRLSNVTVGGKPDGSAGR